MKQVIDLDLWKRKEHYLFFKNHQEPFFSLTAHVDCTQAYTYTKEKNLSFFLHYMYQSLRTVNAIEEFKYRIEGEKVVCYDRIHASTTALNANGLFAFAFMPYVDSFEEFYTLAKKELALVKSITTMNVCEDSGRPDVIHYTTIPWVSFTSLTHERNFSRPDSIPKISFGKYFKEGERLLLPVSVKGHHGLMDGFHVGRYFELFQELLNGK